MKCLIRPADRFSALARGLPCLSITFRNALSVYDNDGGLERDPSLDTPLELDGQVLIVDPETKYWVRFVVRRVPMSDAKPHGLDYSLTLHGPDGERLMGFDNAHPVRAVRAREEKSVWRSITSTG